MAVPFLPPDEGAVFGAPIGPPRRSRLLPGDARRDPGGVHRRLPPTPLSRRGGLVGRRRTDFRRRGPVLGLEVPAGSVPSGGVGAGAVRGGRGVRVAL